MGNEIIITRNAYAKMRERFGIKKNATQRMAEKAFRHGITIGDTKGKLLRYITASSVEYNRPNTKIIIYGEAMYCFVCNYDEYSVRPENNTLITVQYLPKDIKKQALCLQRRIKNRFMEVAG